MFNHDFELEKRYHPENFMLDDDIADFEHDNFELVRKVKKNKNVKKN
jgi:hypothetical protein